MAMISSFGCFCGLGDSKTAIAVICIYILISKEKVEYFLRPSERIKSWGVPFFHFLKSRSLGSEWPTFNNKTKIYAEVICWIADGTNHLMMYDQARVFIFVIREIQYLIKD